MATETYSYTVPEALVLSEGDSLEKSYGSPTIKVIGVGGGGCNAVSRMYEERVPGVEYVVINTDQQHLSRIQVPNKIALGPRLSRGLGVGGNPEKGRDSAEESREELSELVKGCDMVFIAAGMGGGTGTGAAPVIAEVAKESGALTVAVVTRPFSFERRQKKAEQGIEALKQKVDTLVAISNDRLLSLFANGHTTTWEEAQRLADTVLQRGIQGIAEVVTVPGDINVDFADVKTVMTGAGSAWMGLGTGTGENRAAKAAKMAIESPLLDVSLDGAKRMLFVVTGGSSMTIKDVDEAASVIEGIADEDASVFFGTVKDPNMDDEIQVTLIATGFPPQKASPDEQEEGIYRYLGTAVPPAEPERQGPTHTENISSDEVYSGTVRLRMDAIESLPVVTRFVQALRQQLYFRLVQLVGNYKGTMTISLVLREPMALKQVLLGMDGVAQVDAAEGEEDMLDLRLEDTTPTMGGPAGSL